MTSDSPGGAAWNSTSPASPSPMSRQRRGTSTCRSWAFFLSTRDTWLRVLRHLQVLDITCALQSDLVRVVYTFDRFLSPPKPSGVAVARPPLLPPRPQPHR
ncbi:unnamed protein product [Musa textilis]